MSSASNKLWTVEDFLRWDSGQEGRFEFDGFAPVGMVGGTVTHHRIVRNGEASLRRRLTRCEVFRETVKLRLAHTVRYPDLMVVCSAIHGGASEVTDPVLVVEVLSDGTSGKDRITKNEEYRNTPSVQYYGMLKQERVAATVFSRSGSDWLGRVITGLDATLVFPALEIEIPLAEFYTDVELD